MGLGSPTGRGAAIVTGGSSPAGREVARLLASWSWPIVIVYLEHQSRAEATVGEIIALGGTTVAVRADLADDLDVQRMFGESIVAFGCIDIVVHTSPEDAAILYEYAARYVRERGTILSSLMMEPITAQVEARLRERGITVAWTTPEAVLLYLEKWRQQTTG